MATSVSRAGKRAAIRMSPVKSSFIEAIGYDQAKETIHVRLTNGDTYLYPGMPADRFSAFKRAKSKGKFFAANLQKAEKYTRRRRKQ